ncbi:NAD(P)H-binding protein [Phreatobacter stygius]|uniref:SDR family NAD(P)-dependent oxidoreductase n=1 Tax=Phreatobacter stygius TaxID=1940610 RepID=A0A4D7BAC2_9HYPH|nr:NAD(P)H-binding protein [Phreatobacter stygius]QCI67570.1 SDR family NAD(P)-dependent oxidoreductase [Phreatobacter stygius]
MAGTILVLGATGNVGAPLVETLVASGERVKAASRSASPVAGAEAVRFDISATDGFAAALDGVDRAYVLVPAGHLNVVELLAPVIEAAAGRRIKVVLQTALGVDADETIPYRQAERLLERSGTPFVILRPNWFADNFHTYWLEGVRHGVIAVPAAQAKTSFIDARDIAASAAAVLTSSRFDGQAFNLTGPAALGYADAAAILSETANRPIAYQAVDDAAFVGLLTGAGVPADYARFLAVLFHPVREGWTTGVTDAVEVLTGKAPRRLETYARDHAARFAV